MSEEVGSSLLEAPGRGLGPFLINILINVDLPTPDDPMNDTIGNFASFYFIYLVK